MEIHTRYGRFTAHCGRTAAERDTLIVCSRTPCEMQTLRARFPKLGLFDVMEAEGPGSAMRLPKAVWSCVLERLVLDIDYAEPLPAAAPALAPVALATPIPVARKRMRRAAARFAGTQIALWAEGGPLGSAAATEQEVGREAA